MDGQLSTRGVWVKDAVREPSLTGAACGRTGATGAWRGALDRRGGASRQGAERAGECDGPTSPPRRRPVTTRPQSRAHGPARAPPVRSSMRFVPHKDRRRVAAALKLVYTAPGEEAALRGLGGLRRVRPRARCPQTVATWDRAQAGSRRSWASRPRGAASCLPHWRGRCPLHQRY